MKKLFIGAVLTGLSCGCVDSQRGVKILDKLSVNSPDVYRQVVFQSEEEGIAQLKDLAFSPSKEDAWAFISSMDAWVEIGKNSKFNSTDVDADYLIDIMKDFRDVNVYHFHPSGVRGFRIFQSPRHALPSKKDIAGTIVGSSVFYSFHRNGNYCHKVCSQFGVTETRLTERGIDYFVRNFREASDYSEKVSWRIDSVYDCLLERDELIRKMVEEGSDDKISFTFSSY